MLVPVVIVNQKSAFTSVMLRLNVHFRLMQHLHLLNLEEFTLVCHLELDVYLKILEHVHALCEVAPI